MNHCALTDSHCAWRGRCWPTLTFAKPNVLDIFCSVYYLIFLITHHQMFDIFKWIINYQYISYNISVNCNSSRLKGRLAGWLINVVFGFLFYDFISPVVQNRMWGVDHISYYLHFTIEDIRSCSLFHPLKWSSILEQFFFLRSNVLFSGSA